MGFGAAPGGEQPSEKCFIQEGNAMAWYPDLGTETMITSGAHVRAIGWLSREHPYPTGDVPKDVFRRIRVFCRMAGTETLNLGWGIYCGLHCCEFCGTFYTGANAGAPVDGVLYVFPEMLAHYIQVHGYAPPDEFIDAIMKSPIPGTQDYGDAVQKFHDLHIAMESEQLG